MKKFILFLFALVIGLAVFCGIKTKATGITLTLSPNIGIRNAGDQQGLRFSCEASEDFDGATEHGFYVSIGTYDKATFTAAIESIDPSDPKIGEKPLLHRSSMGTDKDFALTVIYPVDANATKYGTMVTAIAYYKNGDDFVFSDILLTKNVADEARRIYNENDTPAAIITSAAEATRVKVTHSNSTVSYYGGLDEVSFTIGDTVQLTRGTYADNFTIGVNNVTINGINSGVHYDGERNANESIITGNIAISANTHYLTLDGLKFSGTAEITNTAGTAGTKDAATTNIDNFTFRNNIVVTSLASGKGFIYFAEASNSYSNDMLFEYNHFKCLNGSSTLESIVYIDNNINLTVRYNKFEDATNKAFYVNDKTKGLAGNLDVNHNIFTNIGTNAFDVNWFSAYPNGSQKDISIQYNTFDEVDGIAIRFYQSNFTDEYNSFLISNNEFTSVGTGAYFDRTISEYGITFTRNIFNNAPTTKYIDINTLYDGAIINARYNSFKEGGVSVLPNDTKYDSSKVNLFSPLTGDPADQALKVGSNVQLNTSNLGIDMAGTYEYVSCSSDDPLIATVSSTGLITAVDEGATDIHVIIKSYENIELEVHVVVTFGIVGAAAVLEGEMSSYTYGGSGTKVWSTSNDSIATINEDGDLEALALGRVDVILNVNSVEIDRLNVLVTPNEFYVDDNWDSLSNGTEITYNTKTYVKGLNAFGNISSALASGRTINVLAGTYSENISVNTSNVVLTGPNAEIPGTGSRNTEAIISGVITVSASNVTLKGLKLTGASHGITWSSAISNLTIQNILSDATTGISVNGGGRNTIIGSDSNISNLVVRGTKITRNSGEAKDAIAIFGVVTGLTIENCYLGNGGDSYSASEVIRINKIAGVVKIENNEIIWSTSNYSVFLGNVSNSCTSISFANNILKGTDKGNTTTVGFWYMPADCTTNIIGNYFDTFDGGTTISFSNSKSGATANIKYNYFGSGVHYKWASISGVTQTYSSNYYATTQNKATDDYGVIGTLDALIEAYKGSSEFSTYGSICVYE